MRALLAALECQKGQIEHNLEAHLKLLGQAAAERCDLVLFPEMSLTGSADPGACRGCLIPIEDAAVTTLIEATADPPIAACFGIAERTHEGVAHITQLVAAAGELLGVQRKRHLGEGEESFTAASGATIVGWAGVRFGIAICAEAGYDDPFDDAAAGGAGLVLFPSAPGLYGRRNGEESWRSGFGWWQGRGLGDAVRHARRSRLWIALAGQAGSTVDEDFPGLAALVRPDGTIAARLPDWRAGTLTVDFEIG